MSSCKAAGGGGLTPGDRRQAALGRKKTVMTLWFLNRLTIEVRGINMRKVTWPGGLKKTKQRALVMNALQKAGKPLSAQELFDLLHKSGNPLWFSTIYRALDAFLEHGAIRKAAVREDGVSVYEINGGHRHYAVCIGCERAVALRTCPLESFARDLQGFHVVGHRLQISGYCDSCYSKL